jgi:dienelactone hydrolase
MRARMRITVGVLLAAALVLAATACGSDDGDADADAPGASGGAGTSVEQGRPYEVTTSRLTLVDTTRPTPEGAGGPAESSRTVEVWLSLPVAEGPVPLVVFSHGMAGHARKFEQLTRAWAEAGYAVAAPVFPRSNVDMPSSFSNLYDVPSQPGDVSFVIDELLDRSASESDELSGLLDPDRIGAAGLSAGGWTTYRVAVAEETRDPRITAAIAISAPSDLGAGVLVPAEGVPVLVMNGDADPLVPPASVVSTYETLGLPRYLVTLLGGGHAGPWEDPEDALEPKTEAQTALIEAVTLAFWDRYLLGDAAAEDRLVAAATSAPSVAILRSDPG